MVHGPEENLVIGNSNLYGQIQSCTYKWGQVANTQAKVITIMVHDSMWLTFNYLGIMLCWFRRKMVKILSAENKLLDFFAEIITETNTIAIKKLNSI